MKIIMAMLLLLALLQPISKGKNESNSGYVPPNGFVPDDKTAIAIAEAILVPIYGKKQIHSEKPLQAKLKNGIWTVHGTLPEGWLGDTAEVKLAKKDARMIMVEHTK
jgi:hypothetical protein